MEEDHDVEECCVEGEYNGEEDLEVKEKRGA